LILLEPQFYRFRCIIILCLWRIFTANGIILLLCTFKYRITPTWWSTLCGICRKKNNFALSKSYEITVSFNENRDPTIFFIPFTRSCFNGNVYIDNIYKSREVVLTFLSWIIEIKDKELHFKRKIFLKKMYSY